jgi:hypothetical protein
LDKLINTQYGNYVKFIRGTEASWAKIDDSQKSSDTLYFITDTGSATGKLYLGAKLISNGALTSATSLKDLNDVFIEEGITDQSILVYDVASMSWKSKSILDIFLDVHNVFVGAEAEKDGTEGFVPAPKAGEQNLFLRGDATWADPTEAVRGSLEELQNKFNSLVGEDADLSMREIAAEEASSAVASIIADAPEKFDTLKEIADWIQTNQGVVDVTEVTTRVSSLEQIIYGVEADEEAGTPAVAGLQSIVSTLQTDLDAVKETVATHTTEITEIKESLKWQDIIEVTEEEN